MEDGRDNLEVHLEDNNDDDNSDEDNNVGVENTESSSKAGEPFTKKRKKRSTVWKEFIPIEKSKEGKERCKCKHCGTIYVCPSSSGTGNMRRHLQSCLKFKSRNIGQMFFEINQNSRSTSLHMCVPKSQEEFRKIVAEAIVMHDLPFQFVEYKGITKMVEYLNDEFHMVSRNTVKADVLALYEKEKQELKKMLKDVPSRISLTSDLWTSIATDGYICVTSHFVDSNWVLHKRVLSFSYMPSPHDGKSIADKVMSLLYEWGIDKKVFAVTLDNASSNKSFVDSLKGQLNINKSLVCNGEFMHIRCCAHIIKVYDPIRLNIF